MSLWKQITRLVSDPPPEFVFELSESGVAYSANGKSGFVPLPAGSLVPSPVADNLQAPGPLFAALQQIGPTNGKQGPRRRAALILPDFAARVSLIDFDTLPAAAEEQLSLVRFRIKKTVPFDVDDAAVRYWTQPGGGDKKDVVAVTVALEVLARYEAILRNAGFHPGEVTTAGLAAAGLISGTSANKDSDVVVTARMSGHIMTITVIADNKLKLFRCVELEKPSPDADPATVNDEEILAVLYPTFAFVEDELGKKVARLVVCGFDPPQMDIGIEPLRSRFGPVNGSNAGLMGYLEAQA
ncbi:MAG: hypothetical protein ABI824_19755 [Acidobacteriota bacterium]